LTGEPRGGGPGVDGVACREDVAEELGEGARLHDPLRAVGARVGPLRDGVEDVLGAQRGYERVESRRQECARPGEGAERGLGRRNGKDEPLRGRQVLGDKGAPQAPPPLLAVRRAAPRHAKLAVARDDDVLRARALPLGARDERRVLVAAVAPVVRRRRRPGRGREAEPGLGERGVEAVELERGPMTENNFLRYLQFDCSRTNSKIGFSVVENSGSEDQRFKNHGKRVRFERGRGV